MTTGPGRGRLRTLGAAAALLGMVLAGCGKAPTAASTAGKPAAPKLNPAETAAFEIVRVQSIVPFTASQVSELEPMLSALVKDPNQTATQLAADAKQITAVFTPTQQTALKNAGLGSVTALGGGFGGGAFAGRHFSGTRPHFSGTRPHFSGTRPHFSGTGSGKRPAFNASFVYTLALDTLEGKRPTFGPRPGASGTGATGGGGGTQSATATAGGGATATA